jgi:predicted PurR-regulated permease PerM
MKGTKTEAYFFLVVLVAVSAAFLALVVGLWQPIFWATLLGFLFRPLHTKLEARMGGRSSLSAALTVLLIVLVVLVPTFLIMVAVADQGLQLYEAIANGRISPAVLLARLESDWPGVVDLLGRSGLDILEIQGRLSEFAAGASSFVAGLAVSAGQDVTRFAVMSLLMLYLLFFALRDGHRILEFAVWALPIGDERERAIFAKFGQVGRATVKGTLIVGIVQGMLGGIMFAVLGIPGAVFWGAVMIFLSIVPAVGSALVWAPGAVFLAVKGAWIKAIILTLFGVLVIGLVDNILRPLLVGRDTKMPDWLILLSTLGGLGAFGLSGFVAGPIIAAMFLSAWAMFAETWEEEGTARVERPRPAALGSVAEPAGAAEATPTLERSAPPEP